MQKSINDRYTNFAAIMAIFFFCILCLRAYSDSYENTVTDRVIVADISEHVASDMSIQ